MKLKKAIILAGGKASRLNPITSVISKHLLPIYDKPMIYYPISTLMLAGIREFLIITNPEHLNVYKKILHDGSQWGINITYKIQKRPNGIPEALIIGKDFIGNDPICLNLGDHILFGKGLKKILIRNIENFEKNTIFAIKTNNPSDYGVINFSNVGTPISIVEKPKKLTSKQIVCGLYLYDNKILSHTKKLNLSRRNEYEVSELNQNLINNNDLNVEILNKNIYWYDAGDPSRLLEVSNLVKKLVQKKIYVGYLENIAFINGLISKKKYKDQILKYKKTEYGKNLGLIKKSDENY